MIFQPITGTVFKGFKPEPLAEPSNFHLFFYICEL